MPRLPEFRRRFLEALRADNGRDWRAYARITIDHFRAPLLAIDVSLGRRGFVVIDATMFDAKTQQLLINCSSRITAGDERGKRVSATQ